MQVSCSNHRVNPCSIHAASIAIISWIIYNRQDPPKFRNISQFTLVARHNRSLLWSWRHYPFASRPFWKCHFGVRIDATRNEISLTKLICDMPFRLPRKDHPWSSPSGLNPVQNVFIFIVTSLSEYSQVFGSGASSKKCETDLVQHMGTTPLPTRQQQKNILSKYMNISR